MTKKLYVRASGEASEAEDDQVAGLYLVEIQDGVPDEHLGSAALDVFHSCVPVGVLDDFSFTVHALDGRIVEPADVEDYAYIHRGHADRIDEPAGIVFETPSQHRP